MELLHTLADGSSHVDLMLATDPRGSGPLMTFRLEGRAAEVRPGESARAEHIGDHRPEYLTYEGPLSGGRGTVRRLARGGVRWLSRAVNRIELQVDWQESADGPQAVMPQTLRLDRAGEESSVWRVTSLPLRGQKR